MKKEAAVLSIVFIASSCVAFAGGPPPKGGQQQKQGQFQGQAQGQGQIGINKAVGSGNEVEVSTSSTDASSTEVLAPTWAHTPSTNGKEEAAIYSLWGGINKNELSFDRKIRLYLELLSAARNAKQITQEEYDEGIKLALAWTKDHTSPDKAFGILPKVCDNPIINIIACW